MWSIFRKLLGVTRTSGNDAPVTEASPASPAISLEDAMEAVVNSFKAAGLGAVVNTANQDLPNRILIAGTPNTSRDPNAPLEVKSQWAGGIA